MMRKMRFTMLLTLLLLLTAGQSAFALTFGVSDIHFTDLIGNDEGFRWRLITRADRTFELNPGEGKTFVYGVFRTGDFPINNADNNDNDDSFTANFTVSPPGDVFSVTAVPDAVQLNAPNDETGDYSLISFSSLNWMNIAFGNGGMFRLRFLDTNPDYLLDDGGMKLRARIQYDVAPVPEPATFLLLGGGLICLVGFRKKFLR